MDLKTSKFRKAQGGKLNREEIDRIVTRAHQVQDERLKGYREQSLKIHPWVCARCGRDFTNKNVHLLTVHHKDHNHDNNPPDGSNWENLCVYCHDNEHRRYLDYMASGNAEIIEEKSDPITHKPFAGLADMLKNNKE